MRVRMMYRQDKTRLCALTLMWNVVIGLRVMLCHPTMANSGFSTFLNFPLRDQILILLSSCINSSSHFPAHLHRENTSIEVWYLQDHGRLSVVHISKHSPFFMVLELSRSRSVARKAQISKHSFSSQHWHSQDHCPDTRGGLYGLHCKRKESCGHVHPCWRLCLHQRSTALLPSPSVPDGSDYRGTHTHVSNAGSVSRDTQENLARKLNKLLGPCFKQCENRNKYCTRVRILGPRASRHSWETGIRVRLLGPCFATATMEEPKKLAFFVCHCLGSLGLLWEGCPSPRGNTPHLAGALWVQYAWRSRHRWSWTEQRTSRSERERGSTRDRGRRQNKETTNAQTCDDMRMYMFCADTSCGTLSHNVMCVTEWKCREKFRVRAPVGYSGSLSTVNENNCNEKRSKQKIKKWELTSNSIQMRTTTRSL